MSSSRLSIRAIRFIRGQISSLAHAAGWDESNNPPHFGLGW